MKLLKIAGVVLLPFFSLPVFSQLTWLDAQMYHIRSATEREWNSFPLQAKQALKIKFNIAEPGKTFTIRLRQEDVRQPWTVTLNGVSLGKLQSDEQTLIHYLNVPGNVLLKSGNELYIHQDNKMVDDIRVGEIALIEGTSDELLKQVRCTITLFDKNKQQLIPGRITIVDAKGALQPVNALSDELAIRGGCIYTATGTASFTLPAGQYTIYGSRGFEYGVDSFKMSAAHGAQFERQLAISREVDTKGWIAADPHIHTYTYSGHGDANLKERLITIAGEGIELPVMTDHNVVVDVDSLTRAMKLRQYFTPVAGTEYTTTRGHFNVFPLEQSAKLPSPVLKDWKAAITSLDSIKGKMIILNHARDIHNGFRPFDPERHIAVAGVDREAQPFPAHSMEVLNSSAQLKDQLRLFFDWFGMLNRGHQITPIGSSDCHDVSRYTLGQGRTYIRQPDHSPGEINADSALAALMEGKVMISFGLMTEVTVDENYGPGELAPASRNSKVKVRVLGPRWLQAEHVTVYANGYKIGESDIKDGWAAGVKWTGSWDLPSVRQDVFIVAIATGANRSVPFWNVPNPYQRISAEWDPRYIGASGAVWVDGDSDGKKTSANVYARRVIADANGDEASLIRALQQFDEAVVVQTAALLDAGHNLISNKRLRNLLTTAPVHVQQGFQSYLDAINQDNSKTRL